MKAFFSRFFQLIVLALFCWLAMLFFSWPVLGAVALFLGLIGLYLGLRLARRLWVLSRSRVKLAASAAARQDRREPAAHLQAINQKWKAAIATLRKSSLRRFGNPLYALPWYLIIGESGAGKTSALAQSQLGSLKQSARSTQALQATANCDWWFFDRAVVIDTAGRYAAPDGNATDQAEWDRMLELLAKYRFKEGINGLILAIEADALLNADAQIEARGHRLRERINQLIRLFDKRFPIFVLITQCDRLEGFDDWLQTLAPETRHQAMGFVETPPEGEGAEIRFADDALNQIGARLRQHRLELGVKGTVLSAPLLLLPNTLERLRPGLKRFLTSCLGQTPYLEQPLLRGLFLSSAHDPAQSAFLHDLFGQVLPADRNLARPTVIVDRWRLATRNLAAVFWLCLFAAGLAFLMLSYYQTNHSLKAIEAAYPVGGLDADQSRPQRLASLQDMVHLIELIQQDEQNWKTRWLAFSPDLESLEDDIKTRYVAGFGALQDLARQEDLSALAQQSGADKVQGRAEAILALTRSVNLTQARQRGASFNDLLKMPQPPERISALLGGTLPTHLATAPAHMLAAYIAWSPESDPRLQQDLAADQATLTRIVNESRHFSWLLAWTNQQPNLPPVTLRTFWRPGTQGDSPNAIQPALTSAGKAFIDQFLDEMAEALNNATDFQFKRGAFDAWYQTERINAWQSFAWSFDNGEQLLPNEPAWHETVTKADTDASPYYAFLDRLRTEFVNVPEDNLTGLIRFAREFPALRRASSQGLSVDKAQGVLQTINTVGERLVHPLKSVHTANSASATLQRSTAGVQAFASYEKQFDEVAAQTLQGVGQSYQLMADYFSFGADPKTTTSSLQAAADSVNAFRRASGFDLPDDEVIWKLINGPLHILTRYALEQASCYLQKEWEEKVLWKTQMAVSAQETSDQLYGDKGSVWAFVDGPAKPFIRQQATRFSRVTHQGYTLPFNRTFIPFLNQSVDTRVEDIVRAQRAEQARGKTATLLISAQPIRVNPGAKAKPYAANLSIECAQQAITLDNYNLAVTNSFDWSPDQCGDVSLAISIDDLTLTQRYPGAMGMAHFVEDFKDGAHTFTPEDFPQARERLEALDVNAITVRYDFSGQDALLKLADDLNYLTDRAMPSARPNSAQQALKAPERIGQCWTQGPPEQTASSLPLFIRQRAEAALEAPEPPAAPAPEPKPVEPPPPPPATPAPATQAYRVQADDTLYSIARRFHTDVATLQNLNHLKNTDLILVGQRLKIPATEAKQ